MVTLYLLHITPPYKHAKHYLGVTRRDGIVPRWLEHMNKEGANLTRYARNAGSQLILTRIWLRAEFKQEKKLKGRSLKPLCPVCKRLQKISRLKPVNSTFDPQNRPQNRKIAIATIG